MELFCFQHASMLECACHIISYLADVMNALRQCSGQGSSQLLMEGEEKAIEVDSDWVEELAVEEEDSQAEDSVSRFSALLKSSCLYLCVTFSNAKCIWFFSAATPNSLCVLGRGFALQ